MSGSSEEYSAVVYGAGPVGAAVALGLQQRGHRVLVLEKRTEQQVIGDAGKSINLALSTRGRALLNEINVYTSLQETLVPMVCRRFADGSVEKYREPLQSINRNLLTIKLIEAAQSSGVKFLYGIGYEKGDIDEESGEVKIRDRTIHPRLIIGCDGVHGKICKFINPEEPERSSRASEWGYYELSLPPEATSSMPAEDFEHFHIWSGKGKYQNEFIVGLPNHDRSITLTLFALMDDMVGRYTPEDSGAKKLRSYLGEAYDGGLDGTATGLEQAVSGGFMNIWLNDHKCLAGRLGKTESFVFLFGDAALGMEQFLGLAVNLGFEGVHRFLEQLDRDRACDTVEYWTAQAKARNILNAGAKALQQASHKNAASMRDGCDDSLGKAIRAVIEDKYMEEDINKSAFESTHDWWSFCNIPLKVCEAIVEAQDTIVTEIKVKLMGKREAVTNGDLTADEKEEILNHVVPLIEPLLADRARLIAEHHESVSNCFQ